MTPEQFDILLEFHRALIRAVINQATVDSAKVLLASDDFNNDVRKNRSGEKLLNSIKGRYESLVAWDKAKTVDERIEIYNKNNKRNPSNAVFYATTEWISRFDEYGAMNNISIKNGVYPASLKVLKPRLERWDLYSQRLIETL